MEIGQIGALGDEAVDIAAEPIEPYERGGAIGGTGGQADRRIDRLSGEKLIEREAALGEG